MRKFSYSLKVLFLAVSVTAGLLWSLAPVGSIRRELAQERELAAELDALGCFVSYNPDANRQLSWLPRWTIGEGVGTSIDYVSVSHSPRTEAETAKIVELALRLPKLEGMNLSLTSPTPELLAKLEKSGIKSLYLDRTVNAMTDEHCEAVSRIRSLTTLSMRCGTISDKGVEFIRQLPCLYRFTLCELPGTPDGYWAAGFDAGYTYTGKKLDLQGVTGYGLGEPVYEHDGAIIWQVF